MNANTLQLLAVLNLAVSLVLPLVHSWVTHVNAPEPVKVVITAFLAAVTGFITPFISGTQSWATFDYKLALLSIASVFFTSVLSHYGLWKPLAVTGSNGAIQSAVPGGIGGGSSSTSDPTPAVAAAFPTPSEPDAGPSIESVQALTAATGAPDAPAADPAVAVLPVATAEPPAGA